MSDLFKCNYQNHNFKKINSFCMNQNCDKVRLACTDCLRYFHKNHMNDIIDFTQFEKYKKDCEITINQVNNLIGTMETILNFLKKVLEQSTSDILKLSNEYTFQQYQNQGVQMMIWNTIKTSSQKEIELTNQNLQQLLTKLKGIHGISFDMKKKDQQDENNKISDQQNKIQDICSLPIQFEIISNEIIQNTSCEAFVFSTELNLIVIACGTKIIIYEFKCGMMREIQQFSGHQSIINSLVFLHKSNRFISASNDNSIRVWGINNKQFYQQMQLLNNGHTNRVYCLVVNKEENLLISSSEDNTIKFWCKKFEWICVQTLENHNSGVFSISLSDSEQQVVSCGGDNQISVIKKVDDKWKVIQSIQVQVYGKKVCFIDDNSFIFQPVCGDKIEIYGLNNFKFQQIKIIQVGNCEYENLLFPSKFNCQKNLLMHRKYNNNISEFRIEQSINFGTVNLYGTISDDWKYLVTWDGASKKIQVRLSIE